MALKLGENNEKNEILENNKIDYLLNLTKKNFKNLKTTLKEKNINVDNFDEFLNKAIQNLLTKLEEKFNEDYSVFLLETLIKMQSTELKNYFLNVDCDGENLCINGIFEEIEKIKNKSFSFQKELDFDIDDQKVDFDYIDYKIKRRKSKQNFEKNVYYTKKEFFNKLSTEQQDNLLKQIELLDKKEVQKIIMDLEEIYRKTRSLKGIIKNFFVKVNKALEFSSEDLKTLEEKIKNF